MNFDLDGQTGIITGSTRGLGLQLAKALANNKSKVGINGRQKETVDNVTKLHANFFPAVADVLIETELLALSDHLKSVGTELDFLICNVGGGSFDDMKLNALDQFRYMFDLNLISAVNSIRVLSKNIKKDAGKILVISSTAVYGNTDAPVEYILAKFALQKYINLISKDFAKEGIFINTLILGNILLPNSVWERRLNESPDHTLQYINSRVPVGKFGTAQDISQMAAFILSEQNKFIVGAEILIDGGQSL
jgi:3-oxoacyl-[acyl-carrier protein] reductase